MNAMSVTNDVYDENWIEDRHINDDSVLMNDECDEIMVQSTQNSSSGSSSSSSIPRPLPTAFTTSTECHHNHHQQQIHHHQQEQYSQQQNSYRRKRRWKISVILGWVACYIFAYTSLSSNPTIIGEYDEGSYKAVSSSLLMEEQRLSHLQSIGDDLSKEYQPVPPSKWCIDDRLALDQLKRRPMGLCYLAIPHAASTTLRGINMRIASQFASRHHGIDGCIRHDTPNAVGMYYTHRDPLSYLWTFVRDPTNRALSVVGGKLSDQYQLGKDNITTKELFLPSSDGPTSSTTTTERQQQQQQQQNYYNATLMTQRVMNLLQSSNNIYDGVISEGRGGFQLQYGMQHYIDEYSFVDDPTEIAAAASTEHTEINVNKLADIHQNVYNTFQRYDFIGIVERFDESLVALQLLLGLEATDILYFVSNTRHQFHKARLSKRNFVCRRNFDWENDILKTLPDIQHYIHHEPEWYEQNYGDYVLYQAANRSLDRTILRIGLDVYVDALRTFRRLLKVAHEKCHPKFLCSDDGIDQSDEAENDCLSSGLIGCAHQCLDDIIAE